MNILFVFSDTGTSKKQNVFKKSFMQSSTNCNVHLTESIFQTHSRTWKCNKFQMGGVKMKAAGGVKSREDLEIFLEAGCDRIGTSSAVKMLEEN